MGSRVVAGQGQQHFSRLARWSHAPCCVDGCVEAWSHCPRASCLAGCGAGCMPCLRPQAAPSFQSPAPPADVERGYEVHVLVDGVSSQRLGDRSVALQRLAQSGAFLATSEMVCAWATGCWAWCRAKEGAGCLLWHGVLRSLHGAVRPSTCGMPMPVPVLGLPPPSLECPTAITRSWPALGRSCSK